MADVGQSVLKSLSLFLLINIITFSLANLVKIVFAEIQAVDVK